MSLFHTGTINIVTQRLNLRAFILEDAEAFYNTIIKDSLVGSYFLIPTHYSLKQTQTMMEHLVNGYGLNTYNWAITLKDSNQMIGLIRLFDIDEETNKAEIGYALASSYWRQGYMFEAINSVIEQLFKINKFDCLIADCMSENIASIRLLEKIKMNQIGCTADGIYWNNKNHDVLHYQLISSDYHNSILK